MLYKLYNKCSSPKRVVPTLLRVELLVQCVVSLFFFFNDTATTEIYPLSLHDALPILVVTGVGLVCALGIGTEESWRNLVAGCSGIAPITHFDATGFDCKFGGEVKNFDPLQWIEKKELKKMARFIQVGLAGADFAVKSANWKPQDSNLDEVGVYVSSGIGGFDIIEREHGKLLNGGPNKISPFFIPSAIVNLASGQISIRYGARGPNSATATACSASAHAVGDSFKIIERGAAEMMICGGAEATITPMGIGGFAAMKALSTRNDDPAHASRPWDAGRDGFVVGEGAGILVLESLEHAQKRNAPIIAEIVGYGMSGDAYHMTQPEENGDGAYRVMMAALKDATLAPDTVGYVNAHGTSTRSEEHTSELQSQSNLVCRLLLEK